MFLQLVVDLNCRINNTVCTREIFIQAHAERRSDADKPQGKTLFVLNIPPYVHEKELEYGFSDAGPIESIVLKETVLGGVPKPDDNVVRVSAAETKVSKYFNPKQPIDKFKTGYIVFKSTKSLKVALQKTQVSLFDSNNESILKTGIDKWMEDHKSAITTESELEAEVNTFMKQFEAKEERERREARKPEIDEDGWTTVKKGKNAGFEQKESVLKAIEEKMAKDKKRKEFKNFYTFQIRESKQKHIFGLRKRFQQDKLKIEALKNARRFKPF